MFIEWIDQGILTVKDLIWGWPLIIFIGGTGLLFTFLLKGIQFTHFGAAWRYLLHPEKGRDASTISPFQAFLNALSASLGNGSLSGMATAIYSGGPGAAFWVFILGIISMPLRFAEVFCGTSTAVTLPDGTVRGGPIAYISRAPGGKILVKIYIFCLLLLTFASGCAMQCQSITSGLVGITGASPYLFAVLLCAFLVYILLGGAKRILEASDIIVPIKVLLFFSATIIAYLYHASHLWDALKLIVHFAWTPQAMSGGLLGYTIQGAIRYGMARVANATETGLGTAGILYGATGSKEPVRSGIMSMGTTFISNLLVCFGLMVLIVASGAWQKDLYGIPMTVDAYSSVFGAGGGYIVTALSMMFGLGVLVTYIYIGRQCWFFLTNGRYSNVYSFIYCAAALVGALAHMPIVWNIVDISNAGLLVINLYALWLMVPQMRKALDLYRTTHRS